MGLTTQKIFIRRGIRSSPFRHFARPYVQWDMMRNIVDRLIRFQRLQMPVARAREAQQYAEEVVHFARKDTYEADLLVESIVVSPKARRILYEQLVPRYADRKFYVTRIVPQWRYRLWDTAPMCYFEFVDRPGEIRPANPVGWERSKFVWNEYQASRRGRRMYHKEAKERGLIDPKTGEAIKDINLANRNRTYEWQSDEEDASESSLFRLTDDSLSDLDLGSFHVDGRPSKLAQMLRAVRKEDDLTPIPVERPVGEEVEGKDTAAGDLVDSEEGSMTRLLLGLPSTATQKRWPQRELKGPGGRRAVEPFHIQLAPPKMRFPRSNQFVYKKPG